MSTKKDYTLEDLIEKASVYIPEEDNLETLVGKLNWDKDINKEKVGKINIYKLIPSKPINLVLITLITIPSILVIKPPIIKIIVDFINFSLFTFIT